MWRHLWIAPHSSMFEFRLPWRRFSMHSETRQMLNELSAKSSSWKPFVITLTLFVYLTFIGQTTIGTYIWSLSIWTRKYSCNTKVCVRIPDWRVQAVWHSCAQTRRASMKSGCKFSELIALSKLEIFKKKSLKNEKRIWF